MDDRLLHNYHNKESTKADINKVISFYKSLDAKKETFVFTDGKRMELINLQGTIPVTYKSMLDNSQKKIFSNAKTALALESTYNIPICIWLMDTHPHHAPMCYLKPTPNMKISVSQHVDHCGKIYAPYLHEWTANKSDLLTLTQMLVMLFSEKIPLFSVPAPAAHAPQATPYPTQPAPYYMPMPSVSGPASYPYPGAGAAMNPPYPHIQPETAATPYPLRPPPATPYPPYPTGPASMPGQGTGTITEEHIHVSLLSAAEDKVRRSIREQISQWKAELDSLERIQAELNQGKDRLAHLMSKLEEEQAEWEKVLTTLRDKDAELESALANITSQGEMDVDEAVVTTAPLYKQLLNAFAEEAATEDAIYYLGEGLRRNVIDLDVFLKHVRSLSRKQFMLRALMHKCRNKAGLAC